MSELWASVVHLYSLSVCWQSKDVHRSLQVAVSTGTKVLSLPPPHIVPQERDAYLPLAESASKMYFIISDLSKINNMYRFSLASFLRLFQRALQNKQVCWWLPHSWDWIREIALLGAKFIIISWVKLLRITFHKTIYSTFKLYLKEAGSLVAFCVFNKQSQCDSPLNGNDLWL